MRRFASIPYEFEPETRLEGYGYEVDPDTGQPIIEIHDPHYVGGDDPGLSPPPTVDAGSDPGEWLNYVAPKKTPWLLLAAIAAGVYWSCT